MYVLVLST